MVWTFAVSSWDAAIQYRRGIGTERMGNTKPLLRLAPRECPPRAAPAGAARRQAERRGARSGQAAQEKGGLRLRGCLGARASGRPVGKAGGRVPAGCGSCFET